MKTLNLHAPRCDGKEQPASRSANWSGINYSFTTWTERRLLRLRRNHCNHGHYISWRTSDDRSSQRSVIKLMKQTRQQHWVSRNRSLPENSRAEAKSINFSPLSWVSATPSLTGQSHRSAWTSWTTGRHYHPSGLNFERQDRLKQKLHGERHKALLKNKSGCIIWKTNGKTFVNTSASTNDVHQYGLQRDRLYKTICWGEYASSARTKFIAKADEVCSKEPGFPFNGDICRLINWECNLATDRTICRPTDAWALLMLMKSRELVNAQLLQEIQPQV